MWRSVPPIFMMKYKLSILLISLFLITPVSAIDLTNLSQGDTASHTCLLSPKYDGTHHWEECTLCFSKSSYTEHDLLSKTTNGTSCDEGNKRITSCSECAYYKEEPAGYKHSYYYAVLRVGPDGTRHIGGWCTANHSGEHTIHGYPAWTKPDGSYLDLNSVWLGTSVKSPSGITTTVNDYTIVNLYGEDSIINYNLSNGVITGDVALKIPTALQNLGDYWVINNSRVVCMGITNTLPYTEVYITPTNKAYDSITKTLTYNFSFSTHYPTADREMLGRWFPNHWGMSGNIAYTGMMDDIDPGIYVDINLYIPTVTTSSYET